ncbi:hybrid sensor histidine kinase/response regulator [Haliea sp. E1-2-M8]|uniref:hybrid sensor histidine kinase/response regulator n=1 Tax=Haliea sp. E1-2-M8 TaxID=3064706 RepID=UPI002721B34F|nr:hybrid sensor histidine kinase/response regulator [Haliea sp. E1-2-M8]MDO8863573.1 hybrid sensor histidine kinase/response regulator [Haliea sp. E1-2-M8]
MADKNNELLARLLAMFRIEADEHVRAMSSGLLAVEKLPASGPEQQEVVEAIFRQAHSLKGAARAVEFTQIESICQPLESIFAAVRGRQLTLSTSLVDLLHRAVSLIEDLANVGVDEAREKQPEVVALVRQLDRSLMRTGRGSGKRGETDSPGPPATSKTARSGDRGTSVAVTPSNSSTRVSQAVADNANAAPASTQSAATATVRVSTKKLDAVMRLSEEMLGSRLAAAQRAAEVRRTVGELIIWRKRSKEMQNLLRPLERELSSSSQASDQLRKLLAYFTDEQLQVDALEDQLATISRSTDSDCRSLGSMTDDLQQRVRDMQLLPCNTLLDLFGRQARALAREQGKDVELSVQGSDIEVDRRLLDEIKDPLIHLMRNCIDHGIEKPAQRRQSHKPPQGAVGISVVQKESGKIAITITDDGAGIDIQRLKAVAIESGTLPANEADSISDAEALDLIFKSGLSTSPLITDLSGRGLGMAIVRDKIEQLGGSIGVSSTVKVGTRFDILVPISLATFRGTLVQAADKTFIIPSANVDRVLRVSSDSIHCSINNSDTIGIDGQALALVWLHDTLKLARQPRNDTESALVIVLGRGIHRVAFRVDTVIGEQEVLVKALGPQLRRVTNVTGASILGNGEVVPVLNVPDLLEAASRQPLSTTPPASAVAADHVQRSILVVEDSITSRALMKNILEAAGFHVVTAVDGIDAYATLKRHSFDLMVSDVDMPRMNGFDLTAKLRANDELSHIPVILVTTLDSREDHERGVDAGANAYIVKSSFDQSNLLEVIQRII